MLRVIFEIDHQADPDVPVRLEETRGLIRWRLSDRQYTEAQAAQLSAVAAILIEGGAWFQLWRGEIVSMASPEDRREGGTVARLHRGPVAEEEAQPRNRRA